ncbi:hypothetical protein [Candidatus Uabimicrobium sp. HlEnr_7]|uniref:hypothetical protein n=1 Tax=Candidatus Uabimicrobium helgolandensis TaxID=3095367 RepID=UPI0035587DFA
MKASLAEIKEIAQRLDTAAVQWMNAGPPESIQSKLNEARESLKRGEELADAPLRIAVVGEFNSGKTLLLNSLLDATDLFPCLLKPTTGNVLEARVHLIREERAPSIRSASVNFFNQFEIEKVLNYFVKNLRSHSLEGVPAEVTMRNLDELEQFILRKYGEVRSVTPKYAMISALEFIVAVKSWREIVDREERMNVNLPMDLINKVLTLDSRPDLNKGIQAIHQELKQSQEKAKGGGGIDKITSTNVRAVFPVIRRVEVDVDAWCAPFGVSNPEDHNTIAFLDFPGLGAESSNARDEYLCVSEIEHAHAVLLVFNGSNPGTSGASVMATLFQRVGKLTSERTLIAVNRFDEFHPLPTGKTASEYYSAAEQGTTVGFQSVLMPAKNALSTAGGKPNLYVCSALCYLFDEKSKRPSWNFGTSKWFNDNKRQAAYTLYKRSQEDFNTIIGQVNKSRSNTNDMNIMKAGLERYLDGAGVPSLRSDLVKFTMDRGEKLIREDAMREIRAAQKILDEIAPSGSGTDKGVNAEVSFSAQEFYRVLELAVADTLPSGPSDYKKLKMRVKEEDVTLWDLIESEIAASVTCWPEWFAILNQSSANKPNRSSKPQRSFGRYKHLKKSGAEVPTEFSAFDERFQNTAEELTNYTLECIDEAIRYSLQRFENHPDYRAAIDHLQGMVDCSRLPQMEEALPLLDVWNPSELAEGEDGLISLTRERIEDEVEALRTMSYPYDGSKPCHWNLALIIRIQVQLMKTYRDRLSRLVAASENNFQDFFCNEVLRAEILPLVRSSLNNPDFLGDVATMEPGSTWENVGQVVRSAVDDYKTKHSAPVKGFVPAKQQDIPDEPPGESRSGTTAAAATVATAAAATAAAATMDEPQDEPLEDTAMEEPTQDAGEIIDEEEFEEW